MGIQLQDAINQAPSFSELVTIAEQLEPGVTFFGSSYVVAKSEHGEPSPYVGEAPIYAVVYRALDIIDEKGYKRSTYPERDKAKLLDAQIDRIYDMDIANGQWNIIGRIVIFVRAIFAILTLDVDMFDKIKHQGTWRGKPRPPRLDDTLPPRLCLGGHILTQGTDH